MVMCIDAHAVRYGEGMLPCKYCRAAVAFFVGVIPILFIAGKSQVDLPFLQFGFLQAENIGVQGVEGIHKSFFYSGAEAVDIPRNTFHENQLLSFWIYCYNDKFFVIIKAKYYFDIV